MMQYRVVIFFVLICLTVSALKGAGAVQAQCQDAAGGSVDCPNDSNPNEDDEDSTGNISAPERIPGDFDGDGTPDETDQCVEQSGPDWNNGCPTDLSAPPVTDSPDPTAPAAPQDITLPPDGECLVTPANAEGVNVRELPLPDAAVIGTLQPGQTYAVIGVVTHTLGTWYRLADPAGWVNATAVVKGGACVDEPQGFTGPGTLTADPGDCAPGVKCTYMGAGKVSYSDLHVALFDGEMEFMCSERGYCVGQWFSAGEDDPLCTATGICCPENALCINLLSWLTAPDGTEPGGEIPVHVHRLVLPPGGDPPPDPFILGVLPDDGVAQTREHILLARQVGMSTEDGVIPFNLVIDSGEGDPVPVGMLLPAVQKVREAAARVSVWEMVLIGFPETFPPDPDAMSLAQPTGGTAYECHKLNPSKSGGWGWGCGCHGHGDCIDMISNGVCDGGVFACPTDGNCACVFNE